MTDPAAAKDAREPSGGSRLLIDLGPVILFFVVNWKFGIFVATGAFMVAMLAAMLFSQIRYRWISPLLWFSGGMVLIAGGITLWVHNETFIKMKPTVFYLGVSALLFFGLVRRYNVLKIALGSTYPGLAEAGWRKLSRNWAIFFAFMACLNEAVWRNSTTDFWVGFKLWGAIPLTFLFAAANVPMLLKYGLARDDAAPAEPGPVE